MWLHSLLLLSMALTGLSEMIAWTEKQAAPCTLTYTPYMAPQIGPTSTIYGAVMTTYFYCVDCTHCTVTNAQHNPAPQGPFTAKTTSSMLTITQVVCIPEATAITRRDEDITRRHEETASNPHPAQVEAWQPLRGSNIIRRSEESSLLHFASSFTVDTPPDSQLVSAPAAKEATAIKTAIFALNFADSGMNVKSGCEQMQNADVRYDLLSSGFDADQCRSLLCWIADHGYDFETSRAQLFDALDTAMYGLYVGPGYGSNRTAICESLDLFNQVGGYLGIDTQAYHDIVCTNLPTDTPTPPIWYGPTPIIPYYTDGITTWGPPSTWLPNTTISGTGIATWTSNRTTVGTGFSTWSSNRTTWGPPISYTGTAQSDWPGTWSPQTNWTQPEATPTPAASDSAAGSGASNETILAARTPRGRNEAAFYPAVPTTQRHGLFKRY